MEMSRSEIFEKLQEVLQMVMPTLNVSETEITEESNLVNDIGLSSVGILYVVIGIEEFFGIRFDDVGFADFETIKDVIDYIEKKI
jgi:acyl carrier protein